LFYEVFINKNIMKIIISELQLKKIKNLLLEEGEAVSIINNGQKLSGKCVKGNCKNGIGNATFSDGSKYSGNWVGGNRTYGKFFDKSAKTTFTGTWSGGLKNGNFTLVDSNGTEFGKYVNNKKQGKWSYKYNNGATSVRTFNNGKVTYYSDSDGHKESEDASGNFYQVDSYGRKTYYDANGNSYTVDANGTKISKDASGNETIVYADGDKRTSSADGTNYIVSDLGNGEKRYNSYEREDDGSLANDYAIEKRIKSGGGFEYYSGNLKNGKLNGNGKVCKSLDETTMVLAGCVSATFLNGKRVYKDTTASGLNKCSRYTDCSTKTTNDKYFKCDSCEKIGTLQACLKIKNPNLVADNKWGPNTESALNKLGYSSVSGITDTDITKICGGTSETMPVSERDLRRLVSRVINENKKEDTMKYFESVGNDIQKSVLKAVRTAVDPYRIRNHPNYFKQVCEYVWGDVEWGDELPSKRDFIKFMKRDFADQIENHHFHLAK